MLSGLSIPTMAEGAAGELLGSSFVWVWACSRPTLISPTRALSPQSPTHTQPWRSAAASAVESTAGSAVASGVKTVVVMATLAGATAAAMGLSRRRRSGHPSPLPPIPHPHPTMAERGGERGGERDGFGRGFGRGDRGGRGNRGGRRGSCRGPRQEEEKWVPVTKLGCLMKDGRFTKMEEIYLYSLPVKEHQIMESLCPRLKDEVMKIMPMQKQTRAEQHTRFKAFVVVDDSNSHIDLGIKCAKEVATAIRGAIILAKISIMPIRRGY